MDAITSFRGEFRFLSNFYKLATPVILHDVVYYYTENAYIASRTTDPQLWMKIQQMTPGQAKRFGGEILEKGLSVHPKWSDAYRILIMNDLVHQKFVGDMDLRLRLLATENREIIEGNNWHDNFFGICICGACPIDKRRPKHEQNNLGKILMQVRERV